MVELHRLERVASVAHQTIGVSVNADIPKEIGPRFWHAQSAIKPGQVPLRPGQIWRTSLVDVTIKIDRLVFDRPANSPAPSGIWVNICRLQWHHERQDARTVWHPVFINCSESEFVGVLERQSYRLYSDTAANDSEIIPWELIASSVQ